MNFSNPFFILFRSYIRKIIPNIFLELIRKAFYQENYENNFDKEMIKKLKRNFVVFDVGANIGFYTKKFASKVGKNGNVYAFEPVEESAYCIEKIQSKYPWIKLDKIVVGDKNKTTPFTINIEEVNQTNTNGYFGSMVSIDDNKENTVEVKMHTLDYLMEKYTIPDFLKIDVEGFELNVLIGAKKMLQSKKLKHIFIEIHFALLEKRGEIYGPKKINDLLKKSGFKIRYLDPSHIYAFRD